MYHAALSVGRSLSLAVTRLVAERRSLRKLSAYFIAAAVVSLLFADIHISTGDPAGELWRMTTGLATPTIAEWGQWWNAVANTLAFALQGVGLATLAGFCLALLYQYRWVRVVAAILRSVHEVFWALIFIQLFGISTLAGVLAIALPFCGTMAKVFGEQLEEVDGTAAAAVDRVHTNSVVHLLYTRLPQARHPIGNYVAYRLECAIRSSVVLGFIGLPTLGFHLETALRTGEYSDAGGYLLTLLAMVFSLRFWFRARWLAAFAAMAFALRPPSGQWHSVGFLQFLHDCIPAPLREDWDLDKTQRWFVWVGDQVIVGSWNTLLVAQIVLVLTGLFALLGSTLNSSHFSRGWPRKCGDGLLLVLRSLPEYLLNFVGLILFGPSMLPAIIAMTLHNGAIISHLLGKHSDTVEPSPVPADRISRFFFHYVPTLYQRFLAYCFYRWEIIIRETAMLGVLGIPTLGFYIDSAFEFLRFDVALILIATSAALTILADSVARALRQRLHKRALDSTPPLL